MSLTTFVLCVDACFLLSFSFCCRYVLYYSCIGNLVCFQRDGGTPVPGCNGNSSTRNDYCIDPNDDLNPHPTPTAPRPPPPTPTTPHPPPSTPSPVPQPTPTTGSGGVGGNLLRVKLIDSDPPPSALPEVNARVIVIMTIRYVTRTAAIKYSIRL